MVKIRKFAEPGGQVTLFDTACGRPWTGGQTDGLTKQKRYHPKRDTPTHHHDRPWPKSLQPRSEAAGSVMTSGLSVGYSVVRQAQSLAIGCVVTVVG